MNAFKYSPWYSLECGSSEISLLRAWKDIQQTFQNVYSKLDWPFQYFKEREQPRHLFFPFLSVIYTEYYNHNTQLSIYWTFHNRLMQGNWYTKASLRATQHRGNDINRLTDSTDWRIQGNCGRHICDLWAALSYTELWLKSDHKENITCTLVAGGMSVLHVLGRSWKQSGDEFGEQYRILKSGRK